MNKTMGVIEQLQESINLLIIKVERLEDLLVKSPEKNRPNDVIGVKEISRILGVSQSEFYRKYTTLSFITRTENGGNYKCLRKNLEKYINKNYDNE